MDWFLGKEKLGGQVYVSIQKVSADVLVFFLVVVVPGPPVRLVFPEVRLTSVRIVWQPPEEPNGIILGKSMHNKNNNSWIQSGRQW